MSTTTKHHIPPWAKDESCLHNPDNVTPEMVGAGHRLLLSEEVDGRYARASEVWWTSRWMMSEAGLDTGSSYRVPLTVPWPPPPSEGPKTERQAFEQWFLNGSKECLDRSSWGYACLKTNAAWMAWQAAIAHHEASKDKEERLAQSPWISTSTRMPTKEDGDKDGHVFWFYEKGDLSLYLELRKPMSRPWNDPRESTHWMTIPPIPTADTQKEEKPWTLPAPPPPKKRVPLTVSDVIPGSAIKGPDGYWGMVQSVNEYGVVAIIHGRGMASVFYQFPFLHLDGWRILRPGQDWQECSKEES